MSNKLEIEYATQLLANTSPEEMTDTLDSLIGTHPTLARLSVVTTALAQPGILVPFIDAVLAEPELFDQLDDRSYQLVGVDRDGNPVETFHSIVLARGVGSAAQAQWDTALHMWFPEQAGKLMEDTHNHARPFASMPLVAAFKDVISKPTKGEGKKMLVYGNLTNEPTGETTLISFPERVVQTGQVHRLNQHVIHEATLTPEQGMIVTLAARGPRQRQIGEVFTERPRHDAGPQMAKIDTRDSLQRFRQVYPR